MRHVLTCASPVLRSQVDANGSTFTSNKTVSLGVKIEFGRLFPIDRNAELVQKRAVLG